MFNHCPPIKLPDLESVTQPDGKRYYVTPSGIRLPSVTTVVGAQSKQAIMEWRNRVGEEEANKVSRKASNRGTKLHNMCEAYLKNEPLPNEMPNIQELFLSVKPFIDKNITDVWYVEQALWSEKVGMAGKVDLVAKWNGKMSIIDYKTSSKIKYKENILSYFWQECAYALMVEDMIGQPIDQLVTLMAVEGDNPLVFVEKTKDHVKGLVDAICFYRKQNF